MLEGNRRTTKFGDGARFIKPWISEALRVILLRCREVCSIREWSRRSLRRSTAVGVKRANIPNLRGSKISEVGRLRKYLDQDVRPSSVEVPRQVIRNLRSENSSKSIFRRRRHSSHMVAGSPSFHQNHQRYQHEGSKVRRRSPKGCMKKKNMRRNARTSSPRDQKWRRRTPRLSRGARQHRTLRSRSGSQFMMPERRLARDPSFLIPSSSSIRKQSNSQPTPSPPIA